MAITQIRGAQVLDATITEDDLNTSVAGDGLLGGGGAALSVNVDAATLVILSDVVKINDLGVDTPQLASNAVTGVKIGNDQVDSQHYVALSIDNEHLSLGSVDVDNLSDLRVTEGTALVVDVAAGFVTLDNGTTASVLVESADTIAVADDTQSVVELDNTGTLQTSVGTTFTSGSLPLALVTTVGGDVTLVEDRRAWLDIDLGADTTGLTEANFEENETPAGDLDGVDVTYTLANTPASNTLKLYLNGIRQRGGGEDFTLATNVITWVVAPVSTDVILADYRT